MNELVVFAGLAFIVALTVVARGTRIPYPIVFMLAGVVIALVPGIPAISLKPELVFLVFLPPLIFGDGYTTDWVQFRRFIRPIGSLAIGLVVVTSIAVGFVAHWLIGVPLVVGFVLGAILSPTDTVATEAIAEEVGMPARLATILSGESLVNDASALVLYKFAVAAVATQVFSPGSAILQFVLVAAGGITFGVAGGWLMLRVNETLVTRKLADPVTVVTITLLTPYLLYIPAERLGVSGVLAAAAGGIFISRRNGGLFSAEARIIAAGVWEMLFFLFNGTLFLLLGLQLRAVMSALVIFPAGMLVQYGLGISATVIGVRLIWVPIANGIRRVFDRGAEVREGSAPFAFTFVLSWAGMRGIVSLAAALAIPEHIVGGAPFPARDLFLFITFAVIATTLLGQGFTLPLIIRRLNVREASNSEADLAHARMQVSRAALDCLASLESTFTSAAHWHAAGKLRAMYEDQFEHYREHVDGRAAESPGLDIGRRLARAALDAERDVLISMRRAGTIADDVFRHMQYDIDLAESRLSESTAL